MMLIVVFFYISSFSPFLRVPMVLLLKPRLSWGTFPVQNTSYDRFE